MDPLELDIEEFLELLAKARYIEELRINTFAAAIAKVFSDEE